MASDFRNWKSGEALLASPELEDLRDYQFYFERFVSVVQ